MIPSPTPAAHHTSSIHHLKWSSTERSIARGAFDLALARELKALIREARERALTIEQPYQLWEFESWLTQRRQEIDRKYDYRYSILPLVFAVLIREGTLTEADLTGLAEDKIDYVRFILRP